ncbi:hypothetical protein KCP69_00890 [Salmonella enterica subsp. enterica]|nr:hypothetical protein KCP69_00890 [Salmonella enterica subsp. enterica]
MNSDLRESGSIERDADLIICLSTVMGLSREQRLKGIAEIVC